MSRRGKSRSSPAAILLFLPLQNGQIISRQTSGETNVLNNVAKPLSKAVKELYEGKIRILPENQELPVSEPEMITEEGKDDEGRETV